LPKRKQREKIVKKGTFPGLGGEGLSGGGGKVVGKGGDSPPVGAKKGFKTPEKGERAHYPSQFRIRKMEKRPISSHW